MELNSSSINEIKRKLGGKTFVSCNLNSLNLSKTQTFYTTSMFDKKIDYILHKSPDFILLQDLRLCSRSQTLINKVKCSKYGNFHSYINSSKDSRGVGILINSRVNYSIHKCHKSDDENAIILDISVDNFRFTLCSIYGPKTCDNPLFFDSIKALIEEFKNKHYLIMGDLNLVTCNLPTERNQNIDLLNAKDIPNKSNSLKIIEWINSGFTTDVFRYKSPEKRDFSYIPFNTKSNYRSRLDHCLSDSFLVECIDKICYEKKPNFFDHRPLSISFKKYIPSPPSIDNNYLDAKGICELVHLTMYNTLSDYSKLDLDQVILQNLRLLCFSITEISKLKQVLINDKLIDHILDNQIQNFHNLMSLLPDYSFIINNGLKISHVLFLRTLINNLNLEVSQFQIVLKKFAAFSKQSLYRELESCKDPELSSIISNQIEEKENEELLRRCKASKAWDYLHLEKPSKAFCSLAKNCNKAGDISVIKYHDESGNSHDLNDDERSQYVSDFFKQIYALSPDNNISIEEFLGQEILNLPEVKMKKLNDNERESLEVSITISELKKVIDKANLRSAPGYDGISYRFVKKFWTVFSDSILNAFNECIEEGHLIEPFNLAKIHLIPKKGNLSDIKNWRPICLLSVLYKIFSGVISNRLKKVVDRITSVFQKSYSSNKNISEAIINTLNRISTALELNQELAIINLDFIKAFDNLQHSFIQKTLSFFNFGPKFKRIIDTINCNKIGFIDNFQNSSHQFPIMSGTAQGDSPSGYLFNICIEILLIKIYYSTSLFDFSCSRSDEAAVHAMKFSSRISAYADDCALFISANRKNLLHVKSILEKFHLASNLKCNLEKSCIMFCGKVNLHTVNYANEMGLKIVNSMKVLGFDIDNKLVNLDLNTTRVIESIKKTVNFWEKINLSLIGRINVAKTFLLSQISYIATVLDISDADGEIINHIICNFVRGKLKISFDKMFKPTTLGGVGMMNIFHFADALKMNLFRRALNSSDSWAIPINASIIDNNLLSFKKANFLHLFKSSETIANCFIRFKDIFSKKEEYIFAVSLSDFFHFSSQNQGSKPHPGVTTLGRILGDSIHHVSLSEIFDYNLRTCKTLTDLQISLNTNLTFVDFFTIRGLAINLMIKFPNAFACQKSFNLRKFILKKSKGSKLFRIMFEDNNSEYLKKNPATISRYKLLGLNSSNIDICRETSMYKVWSLNCLHNKIREFAYKFLNNILLTNAQISHFSDEVDKGCTFCRTGLLLPEPKETKEHLLIHCPFTSDVRISFFAKFENSNDHNFHSIFIGSSFNNNLDNMLFNVGNMLITYSIFKHKYSKSKPTINSVYSQVAEMIEINHESNLFVNELYRLFELQ